MSSTIVCPKCGRESAFGDTFCIKCGASLTKQCPVCREDNPVDARFCKKCRADFDSESFLPGLPLSRALAWKEFSESNSWYTGVDDKTNSLIHDMIEKSLIPQENDPHEPWIICTKCEWKGYTPPIGHPVNLLATGADVGGWPDWGIGYGMSILATRCRLVFLVTKKTPGWIVIPYGEVVKWQTRKDGKDALLELWDRAGRKYTIVFWAGGPAFMDVLTALTGADASRRVGYDSISAKAGQQTSVLEILSQFAKDIGQVSA